MPEVELDVRVDRLFAKGPEMYEVPRDHVRKITPSADGSASLAFEVTLGSRIAFDLDEWRGGAVDLQVRVYKKWSEQESKWQDIGVWQFNDDGAVSAVRIDGAGRWFTNLLEPGTVRVQVGRTGDARSVLDPWVELAPGELSVRVLRP